MPRRQVARQGGGSTHISLRIVDATGDVVCSNTTYLGTPLEPCHLFLFFFLPGGRGSNQFLYRCVYCGSPESRQAGRLGGGGRVRLQAGRQAGAASLAGGAERLS